MLVYHADREMSGPEQKAINWLRSRKSPGIAISGCYIPDRGRSYEADLVVITPESSVVIEVKGILERIGGTLSCPVNSRWSLPGIDGDPVHVRTGDTNPLDQVAAGMFGLKRLAEQVGGEQGLFVAGLVLVVPSPGAAVRLDKGLTPMPTGRDVLRGTDSSELMAWFDRSARRRETPWTAELVLDVLAALGISDAASHTDLLAEGFPTHQAMPADPYSAVTGMPPLAASPPPATIIGGHTSDRVDLGRTGRDDDFPAPYTPGAESSYAAPRRRRSPRRSAVLAAAAFAVVGCGVWYLADSGSQSAHQDTSDQQTAPSSIAEPPPSPTPEPPPPTQAPPPVAPSTSHGCYPFQTNC